MILKERNEKKKKKNGVEYQLTVITQGCLEVSRQAGGDITVTVHVITRLSITASTALLGTVVAVVMIITL